MAFLGSDVSALKGLGKRIDDKANAIDSIMKEIDKMVNDELPSIWKGPDAEKFRSNWRDLHRKSISAAVDALRGAAGDAKRNAERQENTSNQF